MNKTIYALGFFDGIHIGHAALLSACRELAREHSCGSGVVTFDGHPDTLVLGQTPGLINTSRDRELLLREKFHMDTVVALPFDRKMQTKPWQDFLSLLWESYGAAGFVCGEDYRFGHKGKGNARLLAEICAGAGVPCAVIPDQTIDGIRVSSTHIRRLLEAGDMETAVKFLGHPHILSGQVREGAMTIPKGVAIPKPGVYTCRILAEGKYYPAEARICPDLTVYLQMEDPAVSLSGREVTLEFPG